VATNPTLNALVEPLAPDVGTIDRQQIEGVQEHSAVVSAGMQAREIADAVIIAADVLAISQPWRSLAGLPIFGLLLRLATNRSRAR
jgi:hypothetical protein